MGWMKKREEHHPHPPVLIYSGSPAHPFEPSTPRLSYTFSRLLFVFFCYGCWLLFLILFLSPAEGLHRVGGTSSPLAVRRSLEYLYAGVHTRNASVLRGCVLRVPILMIYTIYMCMYIVYTCTYECMRQQSPYCEVRNPRKGSPGGLDIFFFFFAPSTYAQKRELALPSQRQLARACISRLI